MKKIAIVGVHGTGKSKICDSVLKHIYNKYNYNLYNDHSKFSLNDSHDKIGCFYPLSYNRYDYLDGHANLKSMSEQFREVVKDIYKFEKQTEEITLATYAKQLYLENLYTAQGKNILCDRSVLDPFVYYDYFNKIKIKSDTINNITRLFKFNENLNCYFESALDFDVIRKTAYNYCKTYSKIYLIEPSDREIESDGFRLADKKQQFEIHQLFLEYFKGFNNVEIIHQENAHKEEFIEKVVNEFNS